MDIPHIPVLLEEVKEAFSDVTDGYIIDCTLGYGGHSEALLMQNSNIKLICIDQDIEAIRFSKERLKKYGDRVIFENAPFSNVISKYSDYPIYGILADIGVSSLQLDKKERGFSFDSDMLDMRMNTFSDFSAKDVINRYSKEKLEDIFRNYGEVRDYKKIARMIIEARAKKKIESAKELSAILTPQVMSNKNLALIFQAIRIEVNDELGELGRLLDSIKESNFGGCKVAIISFHSLEDRIVKRTFREWTKKCICLVEAFKCECGNDNDLGKVLTKKPIIPSTNEIKKNPRSRSSKMRIFKFY